MFTEIFFMWTCSNEKDPKFPKIVAKIVCSRNSLQKDYFDFLCTFLFVVPEWHIFYVTKKLYVFKKKVRV